MDKVKVNLKENSYEILIGEGILKDINKIITEGNWGNEIVVITDLLVNRLFGKKLVSRLKSNIKFSKIITVLIPRGESHKNLLEAEKVYDKLIKASIHRDALIIALGGGIIGDVAGFIAATYMRGINYVQVPTTLLAQVDASVGGKTGVNHPLEKNLIGAFYQPKAVIIDVNTLAKLPARELRTGLAEVVKYGIIKDAEFFKFIEANAHHLNVNAFRSKDTLRAAMKVWQIIVKESIKIKAWVVSEDEKEKMSKIYKKLMEFERQSLSLDVEPDEKKEVEFINNLFKEWKKFKDEMIKITKKMKESWH
ncbi:MAG: 3-dehydroquinate synthase family protein, partial [Candidatus Margulisbacteria bacterium]|nr:3-dehydroquinate synthase family protein [Candidatus Margulisiibacteriota bacterium]